jgi:hypothetical protein
MSAKNQRVIDIAFINSGNDAQSIEYNPASGGQKSLIVGPKLLPIPISGGWTTNAAAGLILPKLGANIAVYNNAGAAGSITISPAVTTSQAIGAVDASGNVGIACPPNAWTYLSMGFDQYVITSAATLIVYIIEDPTKFIQQTPPLIPQNVPGFVPPISS